ncbi:hypothetical protein BJEO58_02891 [Brevibacterium jeotgali]|uniref:Uncharacterized protein n=1 Tax=Brevibacterium jeotgali TaxID=1262550 RepID=A0A2H1L8Q9_9MICO|nr:hypothetical protein FB108_2905 [Brevibacterium jeotgali]SMY13278.1 hypothetical protein BJEO58_02891 [Brevibacterium jeotgali]
MSPFRAMWAAQKERPTMRQLLQCGAHIEILAPEAGLERINQLVRDLAERQSAHPWMESGTPRR